MPGAGISNDHEGKGTEVVVTAPGSSAVAETKAFFCMGNYISTPNASHASCISNAVTPTPPPVCRD